MKKSVILGLAIGLLVGCGGANEGSRVQGNVGWVQTSFNCSNSSEFYQKLVARGRMNDAIQYVCGVYGLDCEDVSVGYSAGLEGAYAQTSSITNGISIGKSAIHFEGCPAPHDGWLGAVIGHEILHTRQSRSARYAASMKAYYFGSNADNAALELPAWEDMKRKADFFRLTPGMRITVDSEIENYREELKGNTVGADR